jgi:hypothetical protein
MDQKWIKIIFWNYFYDIFDIKLDKKGRKSTDQIK